MSARDRQAEINRFEDMFLSAPDEQELIRELGSPTKQAIAIARGYEPSDPYAEPEPETNSEPWPKLEEQPEQEAPAAPETEPQPEQETSAAQDSAPSAATDDGENSAGEQSDGAGGPVFGADSALSADETEGLEQAEREKIAETVRAARGRADEKSPEAAEKGDKLPEPAAPDIVQEPETSAAPKRRAKPAVLTIYIILSVIIGLPIAIVLIFIGVPFIGLGAGLVAADIYALAGIIPILTMLSDILLIVGAGLIIGAVGLLVTWLGLWISLSLGGLWIGGVIFRLGSRLCFRKEGD